MPCQFTRKFLNWPPLQAVCNRATACSPDSSGVMVMALPPLARAKRDRKSTSASAPNAAENKRSLRALLGEVLGVLSRMVWASDAVERWPSEGGPSLSNRQTVSLSVLL